MKGLTDSEVEALQSTALDRSAPFVIQGVSQSQFSVARHYGGCTFQGKYYVYIPGADELVRDDVVKWLVKYRKTQRKNPVHQATLFLLLTLLFITGCTSVGFHDAALRQRLTESPAPPMTVRLCAALDNGISPDEAQELLDAAWNPDEEQVGVSWIIAASYHVPRPAFLYPSIKAEIDTWNVPQECDRVMLFVSRHAGDFLYSLLTIAGPLPEVLGYADDIDRTRGYIVARRSSILQWVMTPASTLRHELYHMIGCEHSLSLEGCYATIAELRRLAGWVHYVPGWDPEARRAVRLPRR